MVHGMLKLAILSCVLQSALCQFTTFVTTNITETTGAVISTESGDTTVETPSTSALTTTTTTTTPWESTAPESTPEPSTVLGTTVAALEPTTSSVTEAITESHNITATTTVPANIVETTTEPPKVVTLTVSPSIRAVVGERVYLWSNLSSFANLSNGFEIQWNKNGLPWCTITEINTETIAGDCKSRHVYTENLGVDNFKLIIPESYLNDSGNYSCLFNILSNPNDPPPSDTVVWIEPVPTTTEAITTIVTEPTSTTESPKTPKTTIQSPKTPKTTIPSTEKTPKPDALSTEIIIAIGAGGGGAILLIVIIVTVVCLKKREKAHGEYATGSERKSRSNKVNSANPNDEDPEEPNTEQGQVNFDFDTGVAEYTDKGQSN